nr:reverse transcriptase domain-containing protein [Tanacetum cinerariifolium]
MVYGPRETSSATKLIIEERVKVAINPKYPEQTIMIGSTLTEGGRNKLCGLLQRNLDIFTWKPVDMTDVPRHIAKHHQNVREGCSPVRQKKRGQAAARNHAIQKEVGKLVGAGIMREVHYHNWLSNHVMVKKHDGSWRMCVDFKDLNKACLKDDSYKGYHQMQMATKDEDKTAFITSHGIFCYTKMPFGLRNAGATYQRLVDKAFHKQIANSGASYANGTNGKEELIVYLATAKDTISTVLMTEKEAKQMPIYFVSKALRDQPIQQILSRPKVAERLQKWSIELGEYAIHYRPRVSVKGQILADFIVERPEEDSSDTLMEEEGELHEPWILFTDVSSCTDSSGAGLILTNPKGMKFTFALRFRFDATNNEAKYEALITGLRIAEQMRVKNLQANVDSRLVANQVNGTYVAKEADMICYLEKGTLPVDVKKAREIKQKSWWFVVVNESLYKKSFLGSWLRCVGTLQENYVLREIHEGSCSMHAGTRSVMAKALRTGYYWPTMHKHPQTNGLVKRANRSLGEEIKARLDARSKNWIEELPHVLWAHRTMIKSSNGDTQFSLTYGTEAVIPTGLGMPTLRTTKVDLVGNNEALEINLDLLEERREEATIREAKSKAKIDKYYNSKVQNTSFKPGDLVYRNNDVSRAEDTRKLGPKWEGPYEVTESLGKGAYKLRDRDGKQLPLTWNISNLKKCYIHKM